MSKKTNKIIKLTIGTILAILIAKMFNLNFAISAGVVALITIQRTVKETLKLLRVRFFGASISLLVAYIVLTYFGQNIFMLLTLISLVIIVTNIINATETTTVSIVLIGHLYLSNNLQVENLLNEVGILIIGLLIAFLLNLFVEDIEKEININQAIIEENFKKIILQMSYRLKNICHIDDEDIDYNYIKNILKDTKTKAIDFKKNNLIEEKNYYINYVDMRFRQFYQLIEIQKHFNNIIFNQSEAERISDFTMKLSEDFHECNTGEELLLELEQIKKSFKKVSNLCSIIEFENRATLFQYMNDLGRFIEIKYEFSKENL